MDYMTLFPIKLSQMILDGSIWLNMISTKDQRCMSKLFANTPLPLPKNECLAI